MKDVAAAYCVYDDYEFLEASVKSIIHYVDKIFFFISYSMYDGTSYDGANQITLKVVDKLIREHPNQIIVTRKNWKEQIAQRNESIQTIRHAGYKWALIIDADEIFDMDSIKNLMYNKDKYSDYDIFETRFYTYFKSIKYRIQPLQPLQATSLVKTHVKLNRTRGAKHSSYRTKILSPEIVCWHHPSHVRRDEKMKKKIQIAHHEYGIPLDWYDKVWLKWTPDIKNFHPEVPSAFQSVKIINKDDLPLVLGHIYDNEQKYLSGEIYA